MTAKALAVVIVATLMIGACRAYQAAAPGVEAQEQQPSMSNIRYYDSETNEPRYLTIMDTPGVCLYVLHGYGGQHPHLAAVPKTQLPKGASCR